MTTPEQKLCPKCGDEIDAEEADMIAEDMEYTDRVCVACGRCFWEIDEEMDQ